MEIYLFEYLSDMAREANSCIRTAIYLKKLERYFKSEIKEAEFSSDQS